ncbi:hypothetical protein DT73_16120 [Mangrovibacter sp. MFB070]|uniref:GNAT family N-acetyltransferase n=1 Tax=Mangrovibacter sp. MFB070 TaxID=1224318 RepID=UPI0004D4A545|nr:GNAT family N-acetyltransferase [Mangrovibacter sp. MFB070]KEA51773.1 hypothetical protein DT73_16120 [Mangrovibacter sp. MFB070]
MSVDLNQLIKLGIIDQLEDDIIIEEGIIKKNDGSSAHYSISFGWNLIKALICDKKWKEYRIRMLTYLEENYDEEKREELLSKIQVEDHHWNWFGKSLHYREEEYKWFFLSTESTVEAACLIYFPKPSVLDKGDIFYVEFIAVAPWNRFSPLEDKHFHGIGSKLLRSIIKYLTEKQGYQYGFCLHSLPQAHGFYEHIGMIHVEDHDKVEDPDCDPLYYYEIDSLNSMKFVGIA